MHIGDAHIDLYNPGDATSYRLVVGVVNQFHLLFGFAVNTYPGGFCTFDILDGTPSLSDVSKNLFGGVKGQEYTKKLALHVLCYLLGVLPFESDCDEGMIQMIIQTHMLLPRPYCDEGMSQWHTVGLPKAATV
jgi:hypothetical protein